MFVHTGDYVRHISGDILQSTYYTFTPHPLFEGNFYTMDDALAALLAEAHRALGMLEGITLSLSDNGCFSHLNYMQLYWGTPGFLSLKGVPITKLWFVYPQIGRRGCE